jgi:indolepyruvate decarboxylase
MKNNPTVADYAVGRLADLGMKHVFGVAGDYSFPIDNAIDANDRLSYIACSNELNAAYSADGYARIHGAAILTTTYMVGESSALCGVMGCKAEQVPVFHLVGHLSTRLVRLGKGVHHTFGDGNFERFDGFSDASVCVSAHLTPENAIPEMERVISSVLAQRQPGFIRIPEDLAAMPVVGEPIRGVPFANAPTFSSNPRELDAAVKAILARLTEAKSPVILPARSIARYGLQNELKALLAATGIPYATSGMDKAVISESHPQYLGMYLGDDSTGDARKIVEAADLVLDLGGVRFIDFTTGVFTDRLRASRMVTVGPDYVTVGASELIGDPGPRTFAPVNMKDVLAALTKEAPPFKAPSFSRPTPISESGKSTDRVTNESTYSRVQKFLQPGDIVVVDGGTSNEPMAELFLPDGVEFLDARVWSCIGWGTPAAFGAAMADPSRRVVLVQGDGGHQLTANHIGTMGRYGANLIILLLNNGVFGVEETIQGNGDPKKVHDYDKLAPWQYHKLPEAMGCRDWFCTSVQTNADLEAALQKARKNPSAAYIEILLGSERLVPGASADFIDRLYRLTPA